MQHDPPTVDESVGGIYFGNIERGGIWPFRDVTVSQDTIYFQKW
jgi:hypothetical protein